MLLNMLPYANIVAQLLDLFCLYPCIPLLVLKSSAIYAHTHLSTDALHNNGINKR